MLVWLLRLSSLMIAIKVCEFLLRVYVIWSVIIWANSTSAWHILNICTNAWHFDGSDGNDEAHTRPHPEIKLPFFSTVLGNNRHNSFWLFVYITALSLYRCLILKRGKLLHRSPQQDEWNDDNPMRMHGFTNISHTPKKNWILDI